jgi:hypothetical protein
MKIERIGLVVALAFAAMSPAVHAKGCIAGAAVGGVAGHVAGNHGVAGAAVGCAIGHHRAKVKARQQAQQANAAAAALQTPSIVDSTRTDAPASRAAKPAY